MKIQLIQSYEDWESLQEEWDELLANSVFPSIFLSFDYLTTAYRIFHTKQSNLFIITVRNSDDLLVNVAPFRSTKIHRLGFDFVVLDYVTTWEIDKPYIIARKDREAHSWKEICVFLQANSSKWDQLNLFEVPDHLDGKKNLQLFCHPRYTQSITEGPEGPYVDLSTNWEQFLKKHRSFKKTLKRLDKLPNGFEIITYNSPQSIDEGIEKYLCLEKLSWKHTQHGLSKNPLHLEFYTSVIPKLAKNGRVSIRILLTGDKLVAGIICLLFADKIYVQHTVYDPKFSNVSPGTMLMGLVIKQYLMTEGLKWADLLCGYAGYYKPWASKMITTSHISIYRLSIKMHLFLAAKRLKHFISTRFKPLPD